MGDLIPMKPRSTGEDDAEPASDAFARIRDIAKAAAKDAPTREDLDRAESARDASELRAAREFRLSIDREFSIAPALKHELRQAIIAGKMPIATPALKRVHAWRERFYGRGDRKPFGGYLTLYGPRGRGKTGAAGWLMANEAGGLYVSAEELRLKFQDRGRSRENENWMDRVLRARLVVLDDVGTEAGDPRASMFEFVNRRQGLHRAFTLITTNLETVQEIEQRYDARVVDRLSDNGEILFCDGSDLRRAK